MKPSPSKACLHAQVKLPSVLLQIASGLQVRARVMSTSALYLITVAITKGSAHLQVCVRPASLTHSLKSVTSKGRQWPPDCPAPPYI